MLDVSGKKVLIVGHYGSGNYGDDLMLQYLVDEYSGATESLTVVFFYKSMAGIKLGSAAHLLIERTNKLKMLRAWLKAVASHDVVIWGGGTCFTDEEGDGFFIGMMLAKVLGKKFAYRSVGIGKLERLSRKAKAFALLQLCEYVSFRESFSINKAVQLLGDNSKYRVLEEDLGVRYLDGIAKVRTLEAKAPPYVLLAWRDLAAYKSGHQLDNLIMFLKSLLDGTVNQIVVLDADNLVDGALNDEIELDLKKSFDIEVKRYKGLTFSEKNELIANASLVITARLHVGVAAVAFDVPVYVYPYSPKIDYAFSTRNERTWLLNFDIQ